MSIILMRSVFPSLLRSACTTGRPHQLHNASRRVHLSLHSARFFRKRDSPVRSCFPEMLLSVHLALRMSSLRLSACTLRPSVCLFTALEWFLRVPAAVPIPAPFPLLDSSSPSLLVLSDDCLLQQFSQRTSCCLSSPFYRVLLCQ